MYALLMLLPQSEAFKTLHARLHSVPTVTLLKMDGQPPPHAPSAAWDSPSRAREGSERRQPRCLLSSHSLAADKMTSVELMAGGSDSPAEPDPRSLEEKRVFCI